MCARTHHTRAHTTTHARAQDRWGNTALDEARRVGAAPVVTFLERLHNPQSGAQSIEKFKQHLISEFLGACSQGDLDRVAGLLTRGSLPPCMNSGLIMAAVKGHTVGGRAGASGVHTQAGT